MALMKLQEMRSYASHHGRAALVRNISEGLQKKTWGSDDFSIRDLARVTIDRGDEWVDALASRKGGFSNLLEAIQAVDTSQFSGIVGQLFFNKMLAGYEAVDLLWPKLTTTFSSTILTTERIPGVGGIGDQAEIVGEGQPFPSAGGNEEYVDVPAPAKYGFQVKVTKEAVIADHTGLLLKRCADGGRWLSVQKEKRVLDVVCGVTNPYKRNGVATNTYLTSGAYVNSQSNTLVDQTDIENAELLLNAINDPNTGEPYAHTEAELLVPMELYKTAVRAVGATEIAVVDNQASAGTIRQWSPANKPLFGGQWKVHTSPYVKRRTSSSSTWFYGSFKEAFMYKSIWEIVPEQLGANSIFGFTHDIVNMFKISEMGVAAVENPRRVTKNT